MKRGAHDFKHYEGGSTSSLRQRETAPAAQCNLTGETKCRPRRDVKGHKSIYLAMGYEPGLIPGLHEGQSWYT